MKEEDKIAAELVRWAKDRLLDLELEGKGKTPTKAQHYDTKVVVSDTIDDAIRVLESYCKGVKSFWTRVYAPELSLGMHTPVATVSTDENASAEVEYTMDERLDVGGEE